MCDIRAARLQSERLQRHNQLMDIMSFSQNSAGTLFSHANLTSENMVYTPAFYHLI
jgi:hypothetical protein